MTNSTMITSSTFRYNPKEFCHCCGQKGTSLYENLKDRLFEVPGNWSIYQCPDQKCSLMWLNPCPLEEDLHLAYLNYYTHTQAKRNSFFLRLQNAYRQKHYGFPFSDAKRYEHFLGSALAKVEFFRESMDYPFSFLNMFPRRKLLELGAGNGETLKQLNEWGWKVQGIDFDPKAVAACKTQNLDVQLGDLESQKYPNNEFNAIFSSHVLEHVPNPIALMKESLRILDKGGVFVGVTPNGRSTLHSIFKKYWRGLEPPRHIHIFTKESLKNAARQAGFDDIQVITSNFSAAGVCYHSMKLAWGLRDSLQLRMLANFWRLLLTLFRKLAPDSGEELILIARKNVK
jgi:SAM-dependent methyltransferase